MDFQVTINAKVTINMDGIELADDEAPPSPDDVRRAIVDAIDDSDITVADDNDAEYDTNLELQNVNVVEI